MEEKHSIPTMSKITFQNAIAIALSLAIAGVVFAAYRSMSFNTRFSEELQEVWTWCFQSSEFLAFRGALGLILGYALFSPLEHPLLSVFAAAFGIYGIASASGSIAFWVAQEAHRGRESWQQIHAERELREQVKADEILRNLGAHRER